MKTVRFVHFYACSPPNVHHVENKLNGKKHNKKMKMNGISKRDECGRGWMSGELALARHKPVSQIRHYENELARWDPSASNAYDVHSLHTWI